MIVVIGVEYSFLVGVGMIGKRFCWVIDVFFLFYFGICCRILKFYFINFDKGKDFIVYVFVFLIERF